MIVVDNASDGDDAATLKDMFGGYIDVIKNEKNYGFAEGNNIAIRYALQKSNPDCFLLLNNDTVVDPEMLSILLEAAESDSWIGIVGPKNYYYEDRSRIRSAGGTINWWTGEMHPIGCNQVDMGQFDRTREVDWVTGCALLIKRMTLDSIGLLDTSYFAYYEEVDWCVRAKRNGYKVVYAPQARVWHKTKAAERKTNPVWLYYGTRNRFLFMERNASRLQFLTSSLFFIPRYLVLRTLSLVLQERSIRLLRAFYQAIWAGLTSR